MPDDIEVAELSEGESSSEFDEAYSDAMTEVFESSSEEEVKEDPEKGALEEEKPKEDPLEEDPEKVKPDGEEEVDEAEERGKALLEADKVATEKAEADRVDREVKEATEKAEAAKAVPKAVTSEHMKKLGDILSEADLPDEIEVDGEAIDLKEYLAVNPEQKAITSLLVERILGSMVSSGKIITDEQHQKDMGLVSQKVLDTIYNLKVDSAHSDVEEIIHSKEFKEWDGKQTVAVKALFMSQDPKDFILGIQKYKDSVGQGKTKEEIATADAEAKKKKDGHDALYSDTAGKSAGKGKATSKTPTEGSYDDAFDEAADKADKEIK